MERRRPGLCFVRKTYLGVGKRQNGDSKTWEIGRGNETDRRAKTLKKDRKGNVNEGLREREKGGGRGVKKDVLLILKGGRRGVDNKSQRKGRGNEPELGKKTEKKASYP